MDKSIELADEALDGVAGGITDGTSNTVMVGEQPSTTDGTSNTITVGEKSAGITDGTSNTIAVGETGGKGSKRYRITRGG